METMLLGALFSILVVIQILLSAAAGLCPRKISELSRQIFRRAYSKSGHESHLQNIIYVGPKNFNNHNHMKSVSPTFLFSYVSKRRYPRRSEAQHLQLQVKLQNSQECFLDMHGKIFGNGSRVLLCWSNSTANSKRGFNFTFRNKIRLKVKPDCTCWTRSSQFSLLNLCEKFTCYFILAVSSFVLYRDPTYDQNKTC